MALSVGMNTAHLALSLLDRRHGWRSRHPLGDWHWLRPAMTYVASLIPAGLGPWMLSPTSELLYLNTTLLVIYCAGVYASTALLSPFAFGLAGAVLVAPAATVHLSSGSLAGIGIAAGLILFYLFLLPFAVVQARGLRQAVRVAFENEELARRLAVETEIARAAHLQAEEANRAKARFLAAATHDLRQPLHAISLTLEALRRPDREDTGSPHLERMRECTRQLSSMFNALLDRAHLDAGTRVLSPSPVPLAALFAQIEDQFQPQAQARGLWLRCRPTSAVLLADRLALWQITSNLVTNALEATASGGVLVAWRARSRTLEVRDSGCGIAPEHHETVFQEFRRLPQPGTGRDRGLGLGLATVRGLAGLMGATVSLRSAPGRGSVFALHFTLEAVSALPAVAAPAEAAGPAPAVPLAGARVLAVDDDPAVLSALGDLLRQWGLQVRTADSAAEAVRIATDWGPALLVLDRHLPDGSGPEIARTLAQRLQPPPGCLLVTGDTSPEDLQAIGASGLEVMHKPVDPLRLRQAVTRLLLSERVPPPA
jgi:signal transduction histidine kinase/ActR/RegA family two-component response regulator